MSDNIEQSSILVIYEDLEEVEGTKGIFGSALHAAQKIGVLNTEALTNNLKWFCNQMIGMFHGITTSVKNYELDKIEIVIEVTAKGEIKLVGGVSSDLKGGVKLVFQKSK